MNIKNKNVSLVLLLVVVLGGCRLPTITDEVSVGDSTVGSGIEEASKLFVQDDENIHKVVFETNSTEYLHDSGYTLWKKIDTGNDFIDFKVMVKKEFGSSEGGFGVVFSEGKNEETGAISMLTFLIRTDGKYAVGKIENGKYENIQWWVDGFESGSLTRAVQLGFGSENILEVSFDGIKEYTLKANGMLLYTFEDTRDEKIVSGSRGYAVVLSNAEGFPLNSVRVIFEEK